MDAGVFDDLVAIFRLDLPIFPVFFPVISKIAFGDGFESDCVVSSECGFGWIGYVSGSSTHACAGPAHTQPLIIFVTSAFQPAALRERQARADVLNFAEKSSNLASPLRQIIYQQVQCSHVGCAREYFV